MKGTFADKKILFLGEPMCGLSSIERSLFGCHRTTKTNVLATTEERNTPPLTQQVNQVLGSVKVLSITVTGNDSFLEKSHPLSRDTFSDVAALVFVFGYTDWSLTPIMKSVEIFKKVLTCLNEFSVDCHVFTFFHKAELADNFLSRSFRDYNGVNKILETIQSFKETASSSESEAVPFYNKFRNEFNIHLTSINCPLDYNLFLPCCRVVQSILPKEFFNSLLDFCNRVGVYMGADSVYVVESDALLILAQAMLGKDRNTSNADTNSDALVKPMFNRRFLLINNLLKQTVPTHSRQKSFTGELVLHDRDTLILLKSLNPQYSLLIFKHTGKGLQQAHVYEAIIEKKFIPEFQQLAQKFWT